MNEMINYEELATNWLTNQNKKLSSNQMEEFIMFCKMYHLNPGLKEAYAIPFNGQLQLVTNYLVICARAKQNPKYYREVIEYGRNGEKLNHPHLDINNCAGVVICVNIYDKDNNLISNYDFDVLENAQANQGSFKTKYFNSGAEKCAITNALRRTFPNEVAGLYIQEEFSSDDNASSEATAPTAPVKKHPAISASYKNVTKALKEKEPDKAKQIRIIEDYTAKIGKTHDDLTAGNFDVSDFMEYIDEQTKKDE